MVQVTQRRDGYSHTPLAQKHSQRLHQKQRMAQAIAMLPKPPAYTQLPPTQPTWNRAPGSQRRSIDLSTIPPPVIDSQAQANARAWMEQQKLQQIQFEQMELFEQQQREHHLRQQQQQQQQQQPQTHAVTLHSFAAEAIWDLCYASSPAFGHNNSNAVMEYRTPSVSVYAGSEDVYGRPKLNPTTEFRRWTYSILTQTALSKQALFLALFYASRLPIHSSPNFSSTSIDSAPYRLLTITLAFANRWLDDNTYTNKTWSQVTGLSLSDIGCLDMWSLVDQGLNLNVGTDEWTNWMYKIRHREERIYQEMKLKGEDTSETKLVIAAVDDCLKKQFKADYLHSMEFSKQAVEARHRYSPVTDVPLVPNYDYGHIDLDQDGPLRQVHHTSSARNSMSMGNYMSIDGGYDANAVAAAASAASYNMYMQPQPVQHAHIQPQVQSHVQVPHHVKYDDESWGRMGNKPHYHTNQPPQFYYHQPTLGGGLGLGGFQLADYRRGVAA
ncbi:hypothetical protein E3P84_02049 [Wallemia ichthyophaga]|nr:hypothetical protein E3P84_02049 [Wallemia ichthyophaga]TIB41311.1 hypothetical protein E3P83_02074 [Wallemia ichthyophaga]